MGQRHAQAALPPDKKPGALCAQGWVGLRAGLDVSGKCFPPGIEPRTDQPVATTLFLLVEHCSCCILFSGTPAENLRTASLDDGKSPRSLLVTYCSRNHRVYNMNYVCLFRTAQ